jgi:hypothetical protein
MPTNTASPQQQTEPSTPGPDPRVIASAAFLIGVGLTSGRHGRKLLDSSRPLLNHIGQICLQAFIDSFRQARSRRLGAA